MMDCIYEFRYYTVLPFNEEINVGLVKGIQKELQETRRLLLNKAQELKVIIVASKNKDMDDEILKNIFGYKNAFIRRYIYKVDKRKR